MLNKNEIGILVLSIMILIVTIYTGSVIDSVLTVAMTSIFLRRKETMYLMPLVGAVLIFLYATSGNVFSGLIMGVFSYIYYTEWKDAYMFNNRVVLSHFTHEQSNAYVILIAVFIIS